MNIEISCCEKPARTMERARMRQEAYNIGYCWEFGGYVGSQKGSELGHRVDESLVRCHLLGARFQLRL